jgi:hypothetical protein
MKIVETPFWRASCDVCGLQFIGTSKVEQLPDRRIVHVRCRPSAVLGSVVVDGERDQARHE